MTGCDACRNLHNTARLGDSLSRREETRLPCAFSNREEAFRVTGCWNSWKNSKGWRQPTAKSSLADVLRMLSRSELSRECWTYLCRETLWLLTQDLWKNHSVMRTENFASIFPVSFLFTSFENFFGQELHLRNASRKKNLCGFLIITFTLYFRRGFWAPEYDDVTKVT